jgi:hypothetical protein
MVGLAASILLHPALAADAVPSPDAAARKFAPNVNWRARSAVAADFTCRGRRERAILGTDATAIVVAVFVEGTNRKPEMLRYSTEMRDPATAKLKVESLDYDPKEKGAAVAPGFHRSKTCKGLNLNDGKIDAAHIYWNRDTLQLSEWVR